MESELRRYCIAGNWKMNKTPVEASELALEIRSSAGEDTDLTVVLCPPFTALDSVARVLENSNLELGAQNMHPAPDGAFTGEISAEMLRNLFCNYVILGHSERRTLFNESNDCINEKVHAALANNLKPIVCVGESLSEREEGKTLPIVKEQIEEALKGISINRDSSLIIAYEPVWAIGSGKTATPEMAQEVHGELRKILITLLGETIASKIRILYGGSMNPGNASDLLEQKDIDGGLIGGASLEAKSFIQLIEIARSKQNKK